MALSISLAVLLAVIVFVLMRTGHLKMWPALAAVLLGFFLASTKVAPTITDAVQSATSAISAIDL
ncbi:hypothetical protein [Streptomyces tendae]|uniref:hypothetical protein n=1 Tax=Streptomyces tendae TaxID=1932 RepID=UPI003EBE4B26